MSNGYSIGLNGQKGDPMVRDDSAFYFFYKAHQKHETLYYVLFSKDALHLIIKI